MYMTVTERDFVSIAFRELHWDVSAGRALYRHLTEQEQKLHVQVELNTDAIYDRWYDYRSAMAAVEDHNGHRLPDGVKDDFDAMLWLWSHKPVEAIVWHRHGLLVKFYVEPEYLSPELRRRTYQAQPVSLADRNHD